MVFEKKINIDPNSIDLSTTQLKNIIKLCNPSEQFVLTEKYGLISGKPIPMQQIGKKFNMSRERIRQILNKSLNKVRRLISHDENLMKLIKKAYEITKKNGYLISEQDLIKKVTKETNVNLNYQETLLVLTSDYDLYYLHRNKRFKKIFFIEPLFEDLLNDIHDTAYVILKNTQKALNIDDLITKLQGIFLQKFQRNQSIRNLLINDLTYKQIFNLSRYIFLFDNKIGLKNDPEVNPKTTKSKIEYILQKEGKPLHYKIIAKKIKEKFKKNVKLATVHNELVKNPEFINVGMGTYGLKKWGYNGDTTLETIKNILKKAGRPMKVSEIAKEVLKERMIREITVLMVLQKNSDIFKRVKKGTYTLVK